MPPTFQMSGAALGWGLSTCKLLPVVKEGNSYFFLCFCYKFAITFACFSFFSLQFLIQISWEFFAAVVLLCFSVICYYSIIANVLLRCVLYQLPLEHFLTCFLIRTHSCTPTELNLLWMKGSVLLGSPGPVLFEYQPEEIKIESSDGGSHHQNPVKWGRATDDILVQCFWLFTLDLE